MPEKPCLLTAAAFAAFGLFASTAPAVGVPKGSAKPTWIYDQFCPEDENGIVPTVVLATELFRTNPI